MDSRSVSLRNSKNSSPVSHNTVNLLPTITKQNDRSYSNRKSQIVRLSDHQTAVDCFAFHRKSGEVGLVLFPGSPRGRWLIEARQQHRSSKAQCGKQAHPHRRAERRNETGETKRNHTVNKLEHRYYSILLWWVTEHISNNRFQVYVIQLLG